jgi:ribosomal protein L16 Arg81 hydroxylase
MSAIGNLATERARRSIDHLLDAVDQIREELEHADPTETTVRLRDLTERLAEVGITMLAATVVMHEDLDRRFGSVQRQGERSRKTSGHPTVLASGRVET